MGMLLLGHRSNWRSYPARIALSEGNVEEATAQYELATDAVQDDLAKGAGRFLPEAHGAMEAGFMRSINGVAFFLHLKVRKAQKYLPILSSC